MNIKITYKPAAFFVITFLITWSAWFIAAYFSYQEGMEGLQALFMMPGLFAPFIAVLIVIADRKLFFEEKGHFWA